MLGRLSEVGLNKVGGKTVLRAGALCPLAGTNLQWIHCSWSPSTCGGGGCHILQDHPNVSVGLSVSAGCCNKRTTDGGLNSRRLFLTVLEAGGKGRFCICWEPASWF